MSARGLTHVAVRAALATDARPVCVCFRLGEFAAESEEAGRRRTEQQAREDATAACAIQARYRGKRVRSERKAEARSALCIQAAFRGLQGRREGQVLRDDPKRAALKIQGVARRRVAQQERQMLQRLARERAVAGAQYVQAKRRLHTGALTIQAR